MIFQLLRPEGLLKLSRNLRHRTGFLSQISIIKFIEDLSVKNVRYMQSML